MSSAAQVREHYDSLAFIYRQFWGDHIHHGLFRAGVTNPQQAQVEMVEHCLRLAQPPGKRVLDVGCGHGGTAVHLARAHGFAVLGLTLSPKQARIAEENAERAGVQERVRIAVADAEEYDFPAAAFDLVWTMESSEHFADKAAYFRKAAATLAPGGRLLVAAWTGAMASARVREVAKRFLCPELISADDYAQLMAQAGLRELAREDLSAAVVRTWEISEDKAKMGSAMLPLLPAAVREFVAGIPVILDAYRSGDLRYTVMVAERA